MHARVKPSPASGQGSLAARFDPRSIVIVGASERSRWVGALLDNFERGAYAGELLLVNRRGATVRGRASATSCQALGREVDLGLIVVPAQAAAEALEDLAHAKPRTVVLLTSGFAELGPEGARMQAALAARAREYGMRLIGPNSLGFICYGSRTLAWSAPVTVPSKSRGVSIVSQSGAAAYFLTELACEQDLGVSCVVATGNEADLDVSDVLEHLIDDADTHAIALFIETVRNPARFITAARRAFAVAKPIVVLKVGASEATAKAALAHTGSLVGDDRVFDGLCRQLGLMRVHSLEALLATADLAGRAGVLRAGGVAIVSNSGGVCEIAADSAARRGLAVPALEAEVAARIRAALPDFGTPHNPLDLTGGVEPVRCGDALRAIAAQQDIAAVLVVWYPVPTSPAEETERTNEAHRHFAAALNAIEIPGFLSSYTHTRVNQHARSIIEAIGAPYNAFGVDRAIEALAAIAEWSKRVRAHAAPVAHRPAHSPKTAASTTTAADQPCAARPVSERDALSVLAVAGVPVVPVILAVDEAGAIAAAGAGPVAIKVASPDIAHKTDIGGVALGVEGPAQVALAFRRVTAAARTALPKARIDGALIVPMRTHGIELIVGITRDPAWGQVLAVGLGGVWVETLKDVSLRVLPVDAAEVHGMLAELRGAALLAGKRGQPAADIEHLVAVILAIAACAMAQGPELVALEVNPLWVRGNQVEALDALFVWDDTAPPGSTA